MDLRSHPVDAEQRAGLAEDPDDLLDLTVAHPLTDAAEHHQRSGLEGGVVLECEPGIQKQAFVERYTTGLLALMKSNGGGAYFCASSVHWSNHLQAGMSLIQA